MQKNYKLSVVALMLLLFSSIVIAQTDVEYKQVILDGKPAKMNVATGEFSFLNSESAFEVSGVIPKSITRIDLSTAENSETFHIVKTNETLYSISRLYNTDVENIVKTNKLKSKQLHIGQRLQISLFSEVKISTLDLEVKPSQSKSSYVVLKGDTLYSISKANNITVATLKALNNLTSNDISIRETLKLK